MTDRVNARASKPTGAARPIWLWLVLLLTLGVHAPSIPNDFVFDDHFNVKSTVGYTGRPHEMIATLQPLSVYFTSHYLRGNGHPSRGYRPVTVLSYAWIYHLCCGSAERDSPLPQHLCNVLLHTFVTWLVILLLRRLTGSDSAGLLGGLVFGVHAVHSGPVASIVGRGELLGLLFGLLSALAFMRALRPGTAPAVASLRLIGWMVASSVALFVALCSKESAICWVVLAPAMALVERTRRSASMMLREVLLWLLVAIPPVAAFAGLYFVAVSGMPPFEPGYIGNPLFYEPTGARLSSALLILWFGLGKVLVPWPLTCDYGHKTQLPLASSFVDPWVLLAILAMLAVLVVVVLWARRRPLWALPFVVYFGASFVTSNIPFGLETIFAERLLYTPSLALSIAVAAAVVELARRAGLGRPLLVVLLIWCAGSAVITVHRMLVWKDNVSLFTHDLRQRPGSMRMVSSLVAEFQRFGQGGLAGEEKALPYYEAALRQEPHFPFALLQLGMARMREGRKAEAIELFERGLRSPILPRGFMHEEGAKLHFNLGRIRQIDGQIEQAIAHYKQAVLQRPDFELPYYLLLRLRLQRNEVRQADDELRAGQRVLPRDPGLLLFEGLLASRRGDDQAAARCLETALSQATHKRLAAVEPEDWIVFIKTLQRIGDRQKARQVLDGVFPPQRPLSANLAAEVQRLRTALR